MEQLFLGLPSVSVVGKARIWAQLVILTKTVLNFLHVEKELEVKAIDPIIFRNN